MINFVLLQNTIEKEVRNKGIIFLFIFSVLSLYIGNILAVSVKEFVNESNLSSVIANSTQLIIVNVVSLITLIVSIMVGVNSVRSDMSLRILPQILGFSISRASYLLSRVLGSWLISLVFFSLTMLTGIIILKMSGSIVVDNYSLIASYLIYAITFLVVILVATFFSIYLNKIGSFILTIVFYFSSKFSYLSYQNTGFDNMQMSGSKIYNMLFHYFMPRIGELNFFADNFISGKTFESQDLLLALVHFLITFSAWFLVLCTLFNRKEI